MMVILIVAISATALALIVLSNIIGYRIGYRRGNDDGYKTGFRRGQIRAWQDKREDRKLEEATDRRLHAYYGTTEPKRAPGPRDHTPPPVWDNSRD